MESDSKICGIFYSGICLEKIRSFGKINSCGHSFHYKCIYRWSRISNNCPTCRVVFSEIIHLKGSKLLKRIKIHDEYNSTDEEISDSDIEEWQASCQICQSTDERCLLVCEGGFGCSNVCHSYCLNKKRRPSSWICQECENQESESLVDETESYSDLDSFESFESFSDVESNPDEEYKPVEEILPVRRSTRKTKRKIWNKIRL